MTTVAERYAELRARVYGADRVEVVDTLERAEAECVPLGTTIIHRVPPTQIASQADAIEFAQLCASFDAFAGELP